MNKAGEISWNSDLRPTLFVHRILLSFVGIWPVGRKNCFMNLRWILVIFIQLSPMTINFTELYLHCNGMKQSINSLAPGVGAALGIVRQILPRVYRAKLAEIVSSMIDDWSSPKEKRVLDVMRKYSRMSIRVTEFMTAMVLLLVASYVSYAVSSIRAIIKENSITENSSMADPETYSKLSCVFRDTLPKHLFNVVQAVQLVFTGLLTAGTTSFFFALVMHLCGQFDALEMKFARINEAGGRGAIAEIVERHCHLEQFAKHLEESFNISVLVYLFVTAVLISVEGFLLIGSVKHGETRETLRHISVLTLMLVQLSFYTFAGNCLQDRCNAFSYAVYNSRWYDSPMETAKGLRIILTKTMIPLELTAGKFITLDMVTFKDILRSTGSYLSVLQVLMDE